MESRASHLEIRDVDPGIATHDVVCVCLFVAILIFVVMTYNRCLFYRKPMLESGTLGTKGNTQVGGWAIFVFGHRARYVAKV